MILGRSTALAWPICIALFNAPVHAADKTPADLVLADHPHGSHGGREEIPGVAPRGASPRADAGS
jgi:hypothetical protein